eukprot:scaffold248571_cov17-Tisochrysis_lutea.AAC.1
MPDHLVCACDATPDHQMCACMCACEATSDHLVCHVCDATSDATCDMFMCACMPPIFQGTGGVQQVHGPALGLVSFRDAWPFCVRAPAKGLAGLQKIG